MNENSAQVGYRWLPFGVLVAVISLIHAPALWGGTYFLDVYLTEVHPNWVLMEQALADGRWPFWTSDMMLGYPLASNPQVGVFYPFNVLLVGLFGAARGIVWSVWLHSLLAGTGMILLARRGGLSRVGATVAALVYTAAPFFLFYHQALHGLIALAWMPWILWSTWNAAQSGSWRHWALGALFLALQMYGGHLQFVAYTLVATLVVAIGGPEHATRRARLHAAFQCMVQGVWGMLLYGPQLLAAYVLWRHSLRSDLTATDMTEHMSIESFGFDDLVEVFSPRFFGGSSYLDFWYPEFLGIGVFVAVLAAIVLSSKATRPPLVRVSLGLLCAALAYFVLIRIPGVDRLLASIPGLSAFRAPGRLFCWVLLASGVLAGYGTTRLVDMWAPGSSVRRRWAPWFVVCLLATGVLVGLCATFGLFDSMGARSSTTTSTQLASDRAGDGMEIAVFTTLLCVGIGAAKWWPAWRRYTVIGLGALVVFPILWVGTRYVPVLSSPVTTPPLAPVLRHVDSGVRRVLSLGVNDPNYEATVPGLGWPHNQEGDPARASWGLRANTGLAHGISNLHGQTSLPLRRFVSRLYGDGVKPLAYPFQEIPEMDSRLLAHLGVTHVVTPMGRKTSDLPVKPLTDPTPTGQEAHGYLVYTIPSWQAAARFYPYAQIKGIADEAEAMREVRRKGDMVDAPLLVEGTSGDALSGRALDVMVVEERDGYARLSVDVETAGVVLYTESWFPGWTATVDSQPGPVLVADGLFIGVAVDAGKHVIELQYEPPGFLLGFFPLGLGVVGMLFAFTRGRRKRSLDTAPLST